MPISNILASVLLVITLCMGILLAQVNGEKAVLATNLDNAKLQIDEEQRKSKGAKEDFAGCQSALLNSSNLIAAQSKSSADEESAANSRADRTLAALPALISKDRLASNNSAAASNKWMQELFK